MDVSQPRTRWTLGGRSQRLKLLGWRIGMREGGVQTA